MYAWVMGGDTIGTSLKLSWEVAFGNIEFLSGEAYFWLAIRNKSDRGKLETLCYFQ